MKKVLIAFVMLCSVMLGLVMPTNQAAAFDTNCTTRFLGLPAWYDGLVNTSTCEIESPAKDEAKDDVKKVPSPQKIDDGGISPEATE